MIVLYRPSTNKLIKVIEGDFYQQHDVDILDEKTISIYNNNALYNSRGEMKVINNVNEVTIFDLEKNSFSKKFENTFTKLGINSNTNGLIDFLDDSSAIVEDRNNGRIFYLNKDGEVIWEFNNLNSKKILYNLWWSRIIDINKSNLLKKIIEEKKDFYNSKRIFRSRYRRGCTCGNARNYNRNISWHNWNHLVSIKKII